MKYFSRSEFEEGRKKLFELLEKVEGCSHVTDVPTRYVLHDGDLVEMDISENTALHRVHGYLMNDGFMVATWLPNRRGPVRYVMINEILLKKTHEMLNYYNNNAVNIRLFLAKASQSNYYLLNRFVKEFIASHILSCYRCSIFATAFKYKIKCP